jgi:drug/metabolite transporter (DMT)-like permease
VARTIKDKTPPLASGALLLAVLCWGLAPVATRYLLTSFTPLQLVLVRFSVASLLLLPLLAPLASLRLRSHCWRLKEVAWIVFCGITGVIGYNVVVTYGLRIIPASTAGLLIATEPIWILLIAALVLHEQISWPILIGLLLALIGFVLLFGQDFFDPMWSITFLSGVLLILLAALMWSIYTVLVRSLSKDLGARTATALTMVVGTLPLLAFGDNHTWPLLLHLNPTAWLALGFLTLGSTVAATILWNYGVAHATSSQAGLFLYLIPLLSVAGGALFLHERTSVMTLVSGLFIIGGVALAQLFRPS